MLDALDKVEGEQQSQMRRFLPLLIGVIVTLVAGCESKREICARYAAAPIDLVDFQALNKKLGIPNNASARKYCEYYKN